MKYIKKFETNTNLKKYVVWKVGFVLVILEVRSRIVGYEKSTNIFFERLYIYRPDANIELLRELTGIYEFSDNEIKEHVVYQSDNLEDCLDLDLLSALLNSEKYNL